MTLSACTGAPSYAKRQRTRYATATELCRWLTRGQCHGVNSRRGRSRLLHTSG